MFKNTTREEPEIKSAGLDIDMVVLYELTSSLWCKFIFWGWGQELAASYYVWKVGVKYKRMLKSLRYDEHLTKGDGYVQKI